MHLDPHELSYVCCVHLCPSVGQYSALSRHQLYPLQYPARELDRGHAQCFAVGSTAYRSDDDPDRGHAQGGIAAGNVEYQFTSQYLLANGAWSADAIIGNWSTNPQCTWTPAVAENYYLNVYARPVGDPDPYEVTAYLKFTILPANLTGVTLAATMHAPQPTGTPIALTATPQGGITAGNVQYQFVAQYKLSNGSWAPNILLQDWSTNNQCTWTPTTARTYYLNVYARPVGDTVPYAVTTSIVYTVK